MRIFTIDDLIACHWGDCDVGMGETPEAYAMRHEALRTIRHRCWVLLDDRWLTFAPEAIEGGD